MEDVKKNKNKRRGYLRLPKKMPEFGIFLIKWASEQGVDYKGAAGLLGICSTSFGDYCRQKYMPRVPAWVALKERIREVSKVCRDCGVKVYAVDCPCVKLAEKAEEDRRVEVAFQEFKEQPLEDVVFMGVVEAKVGKNQQKDFVFESMTDELLSELIGELKRLNNNLENKSQVNSRPLPARRVKTG
jgi:hypothetical protein